MGNHPKKDLEKNDQAQKIILDKSETYYNQYVAKREAQMKQIKDELGESSRLAKKGKKKGKQDRGPTCINSATDVGINFGQEQVAVRLADSDEDSTTGRRRKKN